MSFFKSFKKSITNMNRLIAGAAYGYMRPTSMVIGTQKCGTTALYQYLSQHPQIVPSIKKELHFFNNDRTYAKGIDHYLHYFEANTPNRRGKITIDVSPGYLQPAYKTAARIYDFDPHLKLIAMLRDPIDRAYSAWQMYRHYYKRDPHWFTKWSEGFDADKSATVYIPRHTFGLSFYDDVKLEMDLLANNQTPEMTVLDHGYYADQLEIFLRLFDKQQLLVISNEEMKHDTRSCLAGVESHLGITHHQWSHDQIKPYFQGGYTEKPTDQEIDLLRTVYQPHNEKLFALLGKQFNWL